MTKKNEEQVQKLRIKIKAYDNKIVDNRARQIVEAAQRQGGDLAGPVPLPTETRKYAVGRSTFVHRSAGDHYEMRIHKRIIDILSPGAKTIDALTNLSLPAGVDIEIKMI